MISRVGSKLGTCASILIGGTIGHVLRKQRDAEELNEERPEVPNYEETYSEHQRKLQSGHTIQKIYSSLEKFTISSSSLPTPSSKHLIAQTYTQMAKIKCQHYLGHHGLAVGTPDLWLAEWIEEEGGWMDSVDFWPPPPSRTALSPPSYSAVLSSSLRALWYISCCSSRHKDINEDNNSVFTHELVLALKRLIEDSTKAIPLALKIIANISVHPEHHQVIYDTGLFDVLTSCSNHHHPYVFLPAWRALHNLKAGQANSGSKCTNDVYNEGIYPYVLPDEDKHGLVDIVLVHGIEGGAPWTWRQSEAGQETPLPPLTQDIRRSINNHKLNKEVVDGYSTCCWPLDWLVPELEVPCRVLALDFAARWWQWGCKDKEESVGKSLALHSAEMRQVLSEAGVGERPIVWITHSMGGLLLKHMMMEDYKKVDINGMISQELHTSKRSINGGVGSLCSQTVGVVFCSVPHHGSALATTVTTWPLSWILKPTQEIYQMRTDNSLLEVLHEYFLSVVRKKEEEEVCVLSLVESEPTQHIAWWKLHYISQQQADPRVGEYCEVETSHQDICKPVNRRDDVYQKILKFLRDTLDQKI